VHVNSHNSALVLVRHGESEWNAEGRMQGHADPPLSERGRAQSRALREVLDGIGIDHAVASDLIRARETAALAGYDLLPTDARWREIDIGVWTARYAAEVPEAQLAAWRRGEHDPAGAETWPAFQARVGGAVDELRAHGGPWLIVTHGGCVRAATAHVTGAPATALAGPANASVTLLELAPQPRLLAYNRADDAGVPVPTEPGGTVGTEV
jgi:glucosyl-3-phosphoglycerate phosphatase